MHPFIEQVEVVCKMIEGWTSQVIPFKLQITNCRQFTALDNIIAAKILQMTDCKMFKQNVAIFVMIHQRFPYLVI